MSASRVRLAVAASLVFALGAVACGGGDGSSTSTGLSGTITISGSSTVQPISNLVAELFAEQNPDVNITVDGPGTGDGFVLFCAGDTDLQDASRPIEPEEAQACEDAGIGYVELPIAFDGITVMVNPASPIECLTTADLYALFGPESKDVSDWSGANALSKELGGAGDLPPGPLEITAPGEESGTYDAFIELAGISSTAEARGLPENEIESLRQDYQSSPNDNVILQAIEGSPAGLGFVGFAYAEEAGDAVKEVQIDGGDGCVAPTRETIADGTYPLSRTLYIYVNGDRARQNAALAGFVDTYVSQEGLGTAVREAGYVDLPADAIASTRSTWKGSGP